jgi:amino acid transporter
MVDNESRSGSKGRVQVLPPKPGGLSTFEGVFTPSILTILGVILYLRLGWVVGSVGLLGTLLIISMATSITFLTALSAAEIATDQRVRTGGAYYMISRSLGIETGGAIGIPLFLALGLSVALYTVGFAESLVRVFPQLDQRLVGFVTTLAVAGLALVSARFAIRTQYFVMAAIGLSILSLLVGSPVAEGPTVAELESSGQMGLLRVESRDFWVVFAVFFPAVTGILTGINLSGDLRNPGRAIPLGTIAAIVAGFLIYSGLAILLAFRAGPDELIADPLIMRRLAVWGDAILLGVWGATLSSALGSILGAPRVLQALARDGVLSNRLRWLGRGSGAEDTPRYGTIFTLGLALVGVAIGELNLIAPILTMFFLTTYGVLNIAAGLERFLGSPSFRPKFKVHWSLSLLGAIGCLSAMMLINAPATAVAALVVLLIFLRLERREMRTAWGDVRRGVWMALTRAGLLRLRQHQEDPKNWRPHILVLSGSPMKRWHLIDLATSLTHNKAIMTIASVLPRQHTTAEQRRRMEKRIVEYLGRRGVHSLVRVSAADDPMTGAKHLVETYGLGSLVPNTILLGDSVVAENRNRYCDLIAHFHRERRNVVIVRDEDERGYGSRKRIDVWWGGLQGNGGLMVILGYLLKTSPSWRNPLVRVKMLMKNEAAAAGASANLSVIMERSRTGIQPEVLVSDGRPFEEVLRESSAGADLVLLGMAEPNGTSEEDFADYFANLRDRTAGLPPTLYVLAAQEVMFGDVLLERRADA